MAAPTQTITGLVLRRTKLGETDVITTILAEDGSQYKAVAKGARKPTSSFASRLEVFAVATILLAQGKNLDIVKEVRLVEMTLSAATSFVQALHHLLSIFWQKQPSKINQHHVSSH